MRPVYHSPALDNYAVTGWAYVMTMGNYLSIINQIYVIPQARGKGMAKNLLTQITEDADRQGVKVILSFEPEEFGSDPDRLRKLYESFGFLWDKGIRGYERKPRP